MKPSARGLGRDLVCRHAVKADDDVLDLDAVVGAPDLAATAECRAATVIHHLE